jgi:hypothetical protein
MPDNTEVFEKLCLFIDSAIESEQANPAEFTSETEARLRLVHFSLREALGVPHPVTIGPFDTSLHRPATVGQPSQQGDSAETPDGP